jgi:hypothetical protein
MSGLAVSDTGPGGGRPDRRDGGRGHGTSGAGAGTSGAVWPRLVRAYLVIAGCFVLIDTVNVLSVLHDAARNGHPLAAWEPITWEASSGVGMLSAAWMIYLALRLATPGEAPWRRVIPVHVAASLAFSGLHIAVMIGLRYAVYAAAGQHYGGATFGDVVYEYRKDVLAYAIQGLLFWLLARPGQASAAPEAATVEGGPEVQPVAATFDIVEGQRILRMPVAQIVAVRAAGNYVEFLLDDGRRPLMRAALGEMESALSAHDFLRTHRSWIVNPARLRSLEAVGSGDYRLGLDGGAEAPLSRRFPAALERLREG